MTESSTREVSGDTPAIEVEDESLDVVNYGILGCGGFAVYMVQALKADARSRVTAAASRSREKAERFIRENELAEARACSVSELLSDSKVEVILVLIPSSLRLSMVVEAIGKKKHILCAAPMGSVRNMGIVWDSCSVKRIQFMDTIAFLHNPRFKRLTQEIHVDKSIGDVLRVHCSVSVPRKNPLSIELEPLGVLGDLGSVASRLAIWAFNYERPQFVKAVCHKSTRDGLMLDVSIWLFFEDDRMASLDVSYIQPMRQCCDIIGKKKWVEMRQFVVPTKDIDFSYSVYESGLSPILGSVTETETVRSFKYVSQETEMISRMSRIVKSGDLESFWPQITLMTERILDACRRSVSKSGEIVELIPGQILIGSTKGRTGRRMSIVGPDAGKPSHKSMLTITEDGTYHDIVSGLHKDPEFESFLTVHSR